MKKTPGQRRAQALHTPIPELVKALSMPETKRRKPTNAVKRTAAVRGQGGFV